MYLFICVYSYSVTRLGDFLDFGQLFKTFGNNFTNKECSFEGFEVCN